MSYIIVIKHERYQMKYTIPQCVLFRKKYKKYFSKGGQFENLIDFGNPHQVAKAAEIEKSIRKKSWTLAEGYKGMSRISKT